MRFSFMFILIAGLIVFSGITLGHGTENHAEESQADKQSPAETFDTAISSDGPPNEASQTRADDHTGDAQESQHQDNAQPVTEKPAMPAKSSPASKLGTAMQDFNLEDFPTLHPMVVHVPVVMIPVAFIFGLISLFFTNRYFVALATAFALTGVLGGYIAAFPMHPHTQGLSVAAARTLQQHDFFAYGTLGITAISVVIGAIALLKPGFLSKGLLALALLLASLCVSVTAHYGGTLTYIHGVGVNGNYLDEH